MANAASARDNMSYRSLLMINPTNRHTEAPSTAFSYLLIACSGEHEAASPSDFETRTQPSAEEKKLQPTELEISVGRDEKLQTSQ